MRRLIASSTILALAATAGLVGSPGADAAAAGPTAPRRAPTPFAFRPRASAPVPAAAQVPAGSGTHRLPGDRLHQRRRRRQGQRARRRDLPGARHGLRASRPAPGPSSANGVVDLGTPRNAIAKIVLPSTRLGTLSIDGHQLVSRGLPRRQRLPRRHDHGHRRQITLTPPAGPAQEIPMPDPGPAGRHPGRRHDRRRAPQKKSAGNDGARASADGLDDHVDRHRHQGAGRPRLRPARARRQVAASSAATPPRSQGHRAATVTSSSGRKPLPADALPGHRRRGPRTRTSPPSTSATRPSSAASRPASMGKQTDQARLGLRARPDRQASTSATASW